MDEIFVHKLENGSDMNKSWALVFEIKNRDKKHLPTLAEAQTFVGKVSRLKQWLLQEKQKIHLVCPVYLSARGFDSTVEVWLHEQGVLTTDMTYWSNDE